MKAALFISINQPLEVVELELCSPFYGQVKVGVKLAGICGAQLAEIRGDKGDFFPRLMGHEGVGIVEQIGPGVKTVKVGDKVVMHWRKGDGIESQAPGFFRGNELFSSGQVVTWATHSLCSENRLTAVPEETSDELCALLGCGLSTAIGTIEQEANLRMGESILIVGCGGLGMNLIMAAKMRRAGFIYVVDVHDKSAAALAIGADAFTDRPEHIELMFNVIIDTTGNEAVINRTMQLLGPSGRYIMVGQPKGHITIMNAKHMFDGEGCLIKATQGGGFRPERDIPRYAKMDFDTSKIISHTVNLDDINEGIDLVKNGQAGRVMVRP